MSARRLRLLVPGPKADGNRDAVLVDGGDLPRIDVDVDSTTMVAAHAALREIGFDRPIVDCVVDQTHEHDLAGATREAFVQLGEGLTTNDLPDGWAWAPWPALEPRLPASLTDICRDRIAELRDGRSPHPLRAPWATEGWFARVSGWIHESLIAAGRSAPDSIVPYRHWGISAVVRVDAPDGRSWFKASYPPFRHEPAITRELAGRSGGVTPLVIAVDHHAAWLLTADLGATEVSTDQELAATIDAMVGLQVGMQQHLADLERVGCPRRSFDELADRFAEALTHDVATAAVDIDPERAHRWTAAVRAAADHVTSLGFPDVLVHGDLHPGNVAATPDGIVIFDWSDACISSPVVDIAVWAWWFEEHADRTDRLWGWFTDAWSRRFGVEVGPADRRAIDIAVSAFHTVSYVRLVETIEPHRHVESADGITHFVGALDRAIRA